jgi:ribonuclease Z
VATLHLLGTGAAASDGRRTTTMLAIEQPGRLLLVDCGGDAAQRLGAHGLDATRLTALIVTHEHADHVGGFPLLMERLWLAGREAPVDVYGIGPALAQVRRLHDAFDVSAWPGYPDVRFHRFELTENAPVFADDALRVTASPGEHSVPCVGLRFDDLIAGGVLAYSCDTAYAPAIVRLARDADLLVHEATDHAHFHSRAEQAAQVAREAGAGALVLVHLPPGFDDGDGEERARRVFPTVTVGIDGARHRY